MLEQLISIGKDRISSINLRAASTRDFPQRIPSQAMVYSTKLPDEEA